MNTYSYSEAKQKLSLILNKVKKGGSVLIKRRDGSVFEIKSIPSDKSPLDVKGVDTRLSKDEIIEIIKESRKK
jgi:antitoxin (DNA-binding transcriptional repressor) of toxin-antitoxin stability system